MPRIIAKGDNLNELNADFSQQRLLAPLFLNSVPKCGTHLVRNIMRMFVPVDQQYHQAFIQHAILRQHQAAFSEAFPQLSWGHLLFADDSAIVLRHVHHIVQVRDPYDWVLARARFFLSDTFQGSLEHLKGGNVDVDEVLNMMIFGIHGKAPTLREIFTHNAVSWLSTKAKLLRFEDLLHHVKNIEALEAETFFAGLLSDCGLGELPADWRERVRVGSDRKQSGTARENLISGGKIEVPDELSDMHKQLVNYAAPGLRKILGYE
ncbi:MAG: hypothetical protein OEW68_10240 [Gammaproteobacteria bacterium]|nr:hypothetical protein [Gammaproteobacteria bacterium]MDH5215220.1 hypothetical protein [Gammaproteobacteria bacterium]MDH5501219.1 hypothetical protein [Gammaproteobacteria bacterium]